MSTVVRSELSTRNKYYISKHRYYELKHYCLQYPEWVKAYTDLCNYGLTSNCCYQKYDLNAGDPTGKIATAKAELWQKMEHLKSVCKETDEQLWMYIFEAVTKGYSFTYLKMTLEMPAEKNMYYDRYRRFFWLLSRSHC